MKTRLFTICITIMILTFALSGCSCGVQQYVNKDAVLDVYSDYVFFAEGFTDVKITDEKSAIKAVASVSNVLGIADAEKELKVISVNTIDDDRFYRMQQYYNDIPVYGKAITVAADKNGNTIALTSNYKKVNADISIEPTVTEEQLQKTVQNYFEEDEISLSVDKDDLVLYETNEEKTVLAYEVNVLCRRVLVDANSSKILSDTVLYNEALVECEYKDGSFMGTKVSDSEYWIGNDKQGIFVLNAEYKEAENYPDPEIAAPMISTDNYFGNSDKYKPKEYAKAVDMLQYLQSASEYFENYNKNHDSSIIAIINEAGSPNNAYGGYSSIKDITNVTIPYETEYISGIYFGENLCKDLYDNIDTLGHEYTHGINNRHFKSDTDESEAINEAYADIFGELIESSIKQEDINWIHGERNMVNPHEYENAEHPYPSSLNDLDKAESYINSDGVKLYYTNANGDKQDFSHFASTIISHCAYLMYEGIDGTQTRKIDKYDLGELWYNSIMLLQDNCSFSQCRNAVELSARIMLRNEQLTEEQYKTVVTAFDTVGIEEANFTYTSTVKNKFDLSVLGVEGTENVSYKLEVMKSIIKPGPNESELIMEKTSLKGKQSLDLENGIYIIRMTDVNDKDNITQTIGMEIVVDGNDSDATDEVVVRTDFTDVITVILNEESNENDDAEGNIGRDNIIVSDIAEFKQDTYLLELDGIVYYVDDFGLWKNEGTAEGECLYECKAINLASNGEVIYYSVYNKEASAYWEELEMDQTWSQYDMYCYDLRTLSNRKITSFVECGKPICVYNNKVYYTDQDKDFKGYAVEATHSLYSVDLDTGEKEFISDKADITISYKTYIYFRDKVATSDTSHAQLKCYDMTNGNIKQITDEGVFDFSVSGDSLFYTIKNYETTLDSNDQYNTKITCSVNKYNLLDGTVQNVFTEEGETIEIQYVDEEYLYYAIGGSGYTNYRIDLNTGDETYISYKSSGSSSFRMSDESLYSVIKFDDYALYFSGWDTVYFYQVDDDDSSAVPFNAYYNGFRFLDVCGDGVYMLKETDEGSYYVIRYYFNREAEGLVGYGA